ncbi:MAG: type II toxin-antitoxin system VapC family toxin [Candidatus Bathyarchaeia archaeon]
MKLLDTSVLIDTIRSRTYAVGAISIITMMEVLRGVENQKREALKEELEAAFPVIPLRNIVILEYCRLYSKMREMGTSIPEADLLIAATAIAMGLTLKTKDEHFLHLKNHNLSLAHVKTTS